MGLVSEPLSVLISEARPVLLSTSVETLQNSAVAQEQHVAFYLFLSYLDTFFHGTGGMFDRPDGTDAVEALAGPQGWRRSSEVRACVEAWARSQSLSGPQEAIAAEEQQEAQRLLSRVALRDPTHVAKRTQGDARFPYMCSGGRPKIGGARLTRLSQLSCIPKSCGRDRGCRLGFLVLSDLLQTVYALLEALDPKLRASVKPLIGDLLLELDGKGPRVAGVPDAVRIAVAAATASCARGWREAGERMDAWREAVQQSAVLAGLRGADDAPVLLAPHQALWRMQQLLNDGSVVETAETEGNPEASASARVEHSGQAGARTGSPVDTDNCFLVACM
ncbi:hypothetical protein HYH03_012239 [Edaphochlamys debaryana]|uniref:Uncharacterized protein n=1 Tax=Edaphochlamys debaryana TaxID=47281 RepID=A0A835XYH7_9CHLO|nr:hypothetical protein HYH03_012239 [Edaphochlamys debaryana]|eukprot:KAG2489215.1 hypothetical protein HYH03_012239 [Edaphochlamys debaryana]